MLNKSFCTLAFVLVSIEHLKICEEVLNVFIYNILHYEYLVPLYGTV